MTSGAWCAYTSWQGPVPSPAAGHREVWVHHLVVLVVQDVAVQDVAGSRGRVERQEVLTRLRAVHRHLPRCPLRESRGLESKVHRGAHDVNVRFEQSHVLFRSLIAAGSYETRHSSLPPALEQHGAGSSTGHVRGERRDVRHQRNAGSRMTRLHGEPGGPLDGLAP